MLLIALTLNKRTNIMKALTENREKRRLLMLKSIKKTFNIVTGFIKPRAVLCAVLIAAFTFSAFLFLGEINTFVINYSGESRLIRSLSASVGNAAKCAGISLEEYKIDSADKVDGKTVVNLLRTFYVFVTNGNDTSKVQALENNTVRDVLSLAGYKIDEYDMVEPALDSVVEEDTYIDYVNIDYISGSYTQAIPYTTQTVYSKNMDAGKKTVTAGKDGLEQINYTQKVVNGEVVETAIDSKVTLLSATNAVRTIGTRRTAVTTSAAVKTISQLTPSKAIDLDSKGNPVNYKKHITVQATAYTYTGHNCSTGVAPKPGYIAVNPKVIPYGTKMYIKSSDGKYIYGYAIAADTGGFIYSRPTNVDLFFPTVSSMNNFGRRNVEIYILE